MLTETELREFTKKEITRCMDELSKTNPCSECYMSGMRSLRALYDLPFYLEETEREWAKTADEVREPYTETTAPQYAEPEPVPVAPTYTKEQVREALGKAQTENHIDIVSIIKSFGCSRLSEIPAEKYGALMETLAEELRKAES